MMKLKPGDRIRTIGGKYPNHTGTFLRMAGIRGLMGTVALDGDIVRTLYLRNLERLEAISQPSNPPQLATNPASHATRNAGSVTASNPTEPAALARRLQPSEELEGIVSDLCDIREGVSQLEGPGICPKYKEIYELYNSSGQSQWIDSLYDKISI